MILFGKNEALTRFLPQAEIVFEYRSSEASGPANQREEFRMGFFACYDRIWELVNLRNDKQHYQEGFFVFDIFTFNERVVREAILNAVSHRNYQFGGSIFVRQYRDRLVVESPGGLPFGITLDNILDRQLPRNRRIAEILSLCGMVERSGQGMNLMFELSVQEAKPLPDFTGTDEFFVSVTLNGLIIDKAMLSVINRISEKSQNCCPQKISWPLMPCTTIIRSMEKCRHACLDWSKWALWSISAEKSMSWQEACMRQQERPACIQDTLVWTRKPTRHCF